MRTTVTTKNLSYPNKPKFNEFIIKTETTKNHKNERIRYFFQSEIHIRLHKKLRICKQNIIKRERMYLSC